MINNTYKVDGKSINETEEWVLKQIEIGEWADLEKYAKNPDHRILGARFLEALLTKGFRYIRPDRKGIRIKNAIFLEIINIENMEVDFKVEIVSCLFKGNFNCRRANFKKYLVLDESIFIKSATFAQIKVGTDFLFRDAKFFDEVTFYESDIGGHFWGNRAEFLCKDKTASFSQINVSKTVVLYDAVFYGEVDFFAAIIGKHFRMSRAKFLNQNSLAVFNSISVKKLFVFRNTVFNGPVSFLGATIGWQSHFHKAEFLCNEKAINFSRYECHEPIFFIDNKFNNILRFNDAKLDNLIIIAKENDEIILDKLEMVRCRVQGEFRINKVKIDQFEATNLNVVNLCNLHDVVINSLLDFRDSSFNTLNLIKLTMPEDKNTIFLNGMTYNNINIDDEFLNWKKYLLLLKRANFNLQPYSQLESFFLRNGSKEIAAKIYVSGKRREWLQSWSWKFWKWPLIILKLILWDWGVRYGRSPFRAVFYSLLFIIIGAWIFSQPGVLTWDLCKATDTINLSKSFWFSFDLFLPLISLGPDKLFQVNQNAILSLPTWLGGFQIMAQTYAYIHQLMGYILVSIGLAAVTGIVK